MSTMNLPFDWDNIPGWFNRAEGNYLYETVLKTPPKSEIIEVGSFRGKSSVAMLLACASKNDGSKVTCVDDFSGDGSAVSSSTFDGRIEGIKLLTETIDRFGLKKYFGGIYSVKSAEWFRDDAYGYYEMFFIDGCHVTVADDMKLAWKHLKHNGIILCHDYDPSAPSEISKSIDSARLNGRHCGVPGTSLYEVVKL